MPKQNRPLVRDGRIQTKCFLRLDGSTGVRTPARADAGLPPSVNAAAPNVRRNSRLVTSAYAASISSPPTNFAVRL